MRKVIRGLILPILGVIILLSLCAGMWGMAEIISFINANNEQAANVASTSTPDWEATVNALSTAVAYAAGKGMSPEQVEAAIAATLQNMIFEVGGSEELATILPTDEMPIVATSLAETVIAQLTATHAATGKPTITTTTTPEQNVTPLTLAFFEPQPGTPVRIPNIANNQACNWMGVGGLVFDQKEQPILNLVVHLEGTLNDETISLETLTGSAPDIGQSGYVFNLSTEPIASEESLWVQLHDGTGNPLSEQVFITTTSDCYENFVMVIFQEAGGQ